MKMEITVNELKTTIKTLKHIQKLNKNPVMDSPLQMVLRLLFVIAKMMEDENE